MTPLSLPGAPPGHWSGAAYAHPSPAGLLERSRMRHASQREIDMAILSIRFRLPVQPVAAAVLAGAAILAGAAARAQDDVHPGEIQACTLLTDPAKLQQCLIVQQGGRRIRGKLSSEGTVTRSVRPDSETPIDSSPEYKGPP